MELWLSLLQFLDMKGGAADLKATVKSEDESLFVAWNVQVNEWM